jgi:choline monooxygenase
MTPLRFDPAEPWLAAQPLATARALPAPCYVEPAMESRDRAAVFARSWQLVGHAAQFDGCR